MKPIYKLSDYIHKEKPVLLTLLGLLSIALFLWLGSNKTKDFGLNFFTEMLGVAVTVFVIDRLIQKREEKRNIPLKLAAYEEVRLFASRYISFWTDTYRQSVPEEDPETIKDFFSDNGMTKILNHLNLDSAPNVTPATTWWNWIVHNAKEFKHKGGKILDRYSHNLDPVAFGYIHQMTESNFNDLLLMIPHIRQSDTASHFPRIEILKSYSIPPQKEDFEAIIGLIEWCNKKYIELKPYNKSIKKITEYNQNKNKVMPPKCMIPINILQQKINKLKVFQQQNS